MSKRPPERSEQRAEHASTRGSRLRRFLTEERTGTAVEVCAALALETVPVTAWLVVLAGNNSTPSDVALPFWWIFLVTLAAWGVAVLLRRSRRTATGNDGGREAAVLVCLGWALTAAASLFISPAAFLGVSPGAALATLGSELSQTFSYLGTDYPVEGRYLGPTFGIIVLLAYLWWRGLWLGRAPLSRGRLYSRFLFGFAALAAAVAGGSAVPAQDRAIVEGPLALMVLAQGFAGLTGIALAQVMDTLRDRQEAQRRAGHGAAARSVTLHEGWVLSAAGLSAGIVLVAGLLAVLVAPDSPRVIGAIVRPLGDALRMLIVGILYVLAFLAYILFNVFAPIVAQLIYAFERLLTFVRNLLGLPPAGEPSPPKPGKPLQVPATIPAQWVTVAEWIVAAAVLMTAAFVLVRIIRRTRANRQADEFEEERESLDASDVLGGQLRDLLNRFRRHGAAGPAEEALAPGSVRYRYREMLRAAGHAGLSRQAGETPDELAARLTRTLHAQPDATTLPAGETATTSAVVESALVTLTGAYDDARYGTAPSGTADETSIPPRQDDESAVIAWLEQSGR